MGLEKLGHFLRFTGLVTGRVGGQTQLSQSKLKDISILLDLSKWHVKIINTRLSKLYKVNCSKLLGC